MPNQDPTQNPTPVNQGTTPPAPPVVFPQSDLPPLSPDFQNLPKSDVPAVPPVNPPDEKPDKPEAVKPIDNDAGSSAPPDISSVISKPKKKFGGGKIIATILGFVVLVGGIGAGIVLTQQKQLFQQKAATDTRTCNMSTVTDPNCKCYPSDESRCSGEYFNLGCSDSTGSCTITCQGTKNCNGETPNLGVCGNSGGNVCGDGCIKWICPNKDTNGDGECDSRDTGAYSQTYTGTGCPGVTCGNSCCQIDYTSGGSICHPPDCKEINWVCPPPTATPTPTPVPQCNSECTANNQCPSGLICSFTPGFTIGSCRNPSCTEAKVNCICTIGKPTPTPTPTPLPPIQLNCNSACYQMDASMECGQGLSCLNASSDPNTLILKCRNPQCSSQANCICPTPTPTPVPQCNSECTANNQCPSGLICSFTPGFTIGSCRNPSCTEAKVNCICPTAPPTVPLVAPSCITVNAYDSNWILIERAQLPSLSAGDIVNFCVNGSAASGTFDRAQFMINTVLKAETTTKRPSSNDFCQSYTILSTDTTVSVRAKTYHSSGVWVGEGI